MHQQQKNRTIRNIVVLIFLVIGFFIAALMAGCNQDIMHTGFKYDKAVVRFPDGDVREFRIKSWSIHDRNQVKITTNDGSMYMFHILNCTLIGGEEND